jgi:lipoate-protein ligase A
LGREGLILVEPATPYGCLGCRQDATNFKPVNDIIANGRKISGNGAAEIGDTQVLVGNFIVNFNFEMMSKVLRVPDEKFRDKVFKTLSENLTTIPRETGRRISLRCWPRPEGEGVGRGRAPRAPVAVMWISF